MFCLLKSIVKHLCNKVIYLLAYTFTVNFRDKKCGCTLRNFWVSLSVSDLDPDPDPWGPVLKWLPWIRIRIRIGNTDLDPDPGQSNWCPKRKKIWDFKLKRALTILVKAWWFLLEPGSPQYLWQFVTEIYLDFQTQNFFECWSWKKPGSESGSGSVLTSNAESGSVSVLKSIRIRNTGFSSLLLYWNLSEDVGKVSFILDENKIPCTDVPRPFHLYRNSLLSVILPCIAIIFFI